MRLLKSFTYLSLTVLVAAVSSCSTPMNDRIELGEVKEKKDQKSSKALMFLGNDTLELSLTWKDTDKYQVKTKGGCFKGMKRFSLLDPAKKDFVYELDYREMMMQNTIVTARYGFKSLSIGNEEPTVYAFDEGLAKRLLENCGRKEGMIFEFKNGDFATKNYEIDVIGKEDDYASTKKHVSFLLAGLYNGEFQLEQVFNVDVLKYYFAISDLTGAHKGLMLKHAKWFFNPIINKIEPIAYLSGIDQDSKQLVVDLLEDKDYQYLSIFFQNENFVGEYQSALNELASQKDREYSKRYYESKKILTKGMPVKYNPMWLQTRSETVKSLINNEMASNAVEFHKMEIMSSDDNIWLNPITVNNRTLFVINGDEKTITMLPGNHKIDQDMIIPKGYTFKIDTNTTIDLVNNALILSYSPLQWNGIEGNEVKIFSSDRTGQGIFVISTDVKNKPQSSLTHVIVDGMGQPKKKNWSITGGLSFYQNDVKIDHCMLMNNHTGDDCLNIIRGDFEVSNTMFKNTFSDAFDADFTTGKMSEVAFYESGNDAFDISGSDVYIEKILVSGVEDKALSAGERSIIRGKNVMIKGAEIGVASKDESTVVLDSVMLDHSTVGYTVFQKKPEFGVATVDVTNFYQSNVQKDFLLEEGCALKINGVEKQFTDKKVRDKLYGSEFGKASER